MKKILIVDYDQSSLSSLQGVLADRGYQVVIAADGQAGWDKYNKECPDLVLMEAMLPKVHGFELCQRITSERNSQATVFIMTGVYKDRVYRTEALRTYGASEYFEKPLKLAELLASVEAVLGRPEVKPAEASVEAPVAASPRPAPSAMSAKGGSAGPTELATPPELSATSATTRSAGPTELTRSAGPTESRRREKPKSDDSMFTLPEDLDRLAREIPKIRKPAPTASEPAVDPKFDALADDLLKSYLIETKTMKTAASKPAPENGNGNGNGKADIDRFLASALAGLDLNKEKVKVPKTAPLPPPPASAISETTRPEAPTEVPPAPAKTEAPAKPAPPPPTPPAVFKPKPAPEPMAQKPAADMKSSLTPGDPGSDVSPFFTPEKPNASATTRASATSATTRPAVPAESTRAAAPPELAAQAEKPKLQPTAAPPAPPQAARPVKPVDRTVKPAATGTIAKSAAEPARPVPPAPAASAASATTRSAQTTELTRPAESAKAGPSATTRSTGSSATTRSAGPTELTESPRPESLSTDVAKKEIRPTVGGDIFQDFHPAEQTERSGGFPKIVPILIGVVAVAAVGFILLRPKSKAPAPPVPRETVQNKTQTETPSQPVVEPSATSATTRPAGPAESTRSAGPTELPAAAKANPGAAGPVNNPAPAKQKVQPKAKPAEPDPAGADAILPILNTTSTAFPPPGGQTASSGQSPARQAKTEETAVQSGGEAAAGDPAGSGQPGDAGAFNAETPAPAPVKAGELVELSSVTEPPKIIKSADPIYPQSAQRLGVGGAITVNALIDENGNVIETGILKGIKDDKGLGRAAENAVRKWKFQPARKNGVAVKVWKSFVIAFKADANPANR